MKNSDHGCSCVPEPAGLSGDDLNKLKKALHSNVSLQDKVLLFFMVLEPDNFKSLQLESMN